MATDDLNAQLEKLLLRAKKTLPFVPKATSPYLPNWSDNKLHEIAQKNWFSPSSRARANVPFILTRFYHFYFNGRVHAEDNLVAVVFDAVAVATVEKRSIWPEEAKPAACPYADNASTSRQFVVDAQVALPQVHQLVTNITHGPALAAYKVNDVNTFSANLQRMITAINTDKEMDETEALLRCVTGYLALTLMRSAVKDQHQLRIAFLTQGFRKNVMAIAGWPAENGFSPPCQQCINLCVTSLAKGSGHTSALFAWVASKFVIARTVEHDEVISVYLSASLLIHTARNGLRLISLVEDITAAMNVSWYRLVECSYTSATETAWNAIADFLATYLMKDNCQYGYNWARIINDGYLRGFSPKDHPFLGIILQTVLDKIQNKSVCAAGWAKDKRASYGTAIKLGSALHVYLTEHKHERD